MNVKNIGCKIEGDVFVAENIGSGVSTEVFKTLSENAELSANGRVICGSARLTLIGITSAGEEVAHREWELPLGNFEVSYNFDPISLAVYGDMQAFFVRLSAAEEGSEFSLSSLALSETSVAENDDTGSKKSVKVRKVPNKMLFIGNSLVFGMEMNYGMCATSADKDYYHYVSEYVRSKNGDCVFGKLYGSSFEHLEASEGFHAWFSTDANAYTGRPAEESFAEDTELIIIQLGDNINTEEKNTAFRKSGDMLIENIKRRSPNADIIWVNGWYNRQPTFDLIASLCERWGIQRIDIQDLRRPEHENHTDELYIGKDGTPCKIKDNWRTHPGNLGMRAIADRIIENLGF